MDESEGNRLHNEIRRLRLAESDMRQVAAAAEALQAEYVNGDLCRALETAIAVCYARPFKQSTIGPLDSDWIADEVELLHGQLLELRDTLYAHTDKEAPRGIVDVAALLDEDSVMYGEGWVPMSREILPTVIAVCCAQAERFRQAARERESQIAGAES